MSRPWEVDPVEDFAPRLGRSAAQLGVANDDPSCPDIWELANGDIAVIGRGLTADYAFRLPEDVHIGADEKLVVIPGVMLRAAKTDIADE